MDPQTKDQNAMLDNSPEQSPYWTDKPPLSDDEIKERSFDLYRLFQISQVRESSLPQFDGYGYSRWNETNEMADISYLAPKKNKGDSRITTGITHEKDSSLVSFYLNMNFEGTVRVFKDDKEQTELGTALTKLVRKSRQEEFYDSKRPDFYRNYTAQGTSFALEEYQEIWVPDKQIVGDVDPTAMDKVQWVDKGLKKVNNGCVSTLVDGKKVFLEDIRERDIQKQPGVYTVEYVPREILKAIWQKSPRWKYVPYYITPTAQSLGTLSQGSIYSDWIWGEIDFNKCEVIKVYRPFEQRFQIYINGVPMLKAKFPLKAVSPSGLIPIAKGDADPMNMFAYSKSEPSKTKIDQAVFDEILQNMIVKSRQSTFVPRANNTGRVLTPDMFLGGRFVSNLDPSKMPPLIDNPGITQFDFSFYELFRKQIDSKTVAAILEGNAQANSSGSLGEYMDQQKKAMLKLGGKIDGIIQWEKQMLRLRTMNLLAHGYPKDEGGKYKDITMNDTMSDGSKGINILKFLNPNPKTSMDVFNEQNQYKKQNGVPAEITYLNPEMMKAILEDPSYCIYYEVVPVDKNNDKITQMMFVGMIQQAAGIFGMDSLAVANLKKQYAAVMGKSYDDIFLSDQDLQVKQQQAAQAQMEAEAAGAKPGEKPGAPGAGPVKSPLQPGAGAPNPLEAMMK